jgi:hypothetical protein
MLNDKIFTLDDSNNLTLVGFEEAEDGATLVRTKNGLAWIKPDTTTVEGLGQAIENLQSDVNDLNDALDGVYTKQETDVAIQTAIQGANHLSRLIVNSYDEIDVSKEDAEKYIYMLK